MQRFKATLEPVSHGGHFVKVPPEVADAAGLKYGARVRGTVDGVGYRSSLMKYSGIFHMGVHEATIEAANATTGGTVDVTIELDDKPLPTDKVPADLQRAIMASKRATAGWAVTSPSHKREHVKAVTEAKKPETRARRLAAAIAMLEAKAATKPAKRAAPKRASAKRR